MAERSTARSTTGFDSAVPDDLTVPLGEHTKALDSARADEVIGASRNPYERSASASQATATMPEAAPDSQPAQTATATATYPLKHDTFRDRGENYEASNPAAAYARAAGSSPRLERGNTGLGMPSVRIITQHLFALILFAAGTVASLYFFVFTSTGQYVDERALTEYANQFSGYQHSTLAALDYLPYAVIIIAVICLVAVLIWKHHFLSALVGVCAGTGAYLTTHMLKNYLLDKPDYGIQDALLNSAPSGHTTFAAAAASALFLASPRALRPTVALFGAAATFMIGISTIINGWHRPGDVVSAIFNAAFWTVCGLMVLRYFRRVDFNRGNPKIGAIIVPLLTITALFLGFCAGVLYLIATVSALPGGVFVAATSMILAVSTGTTAIHIALLRPRNHPRSAYTKVWSY